MLKKLLSYATLTTKGKIKNINFLFGSVFLLLLLIFFGCPNPGSPIPDEIIPSAPTNLIVVSTTDSQVSLSWDDTSDNESGFEIEWSDDGFVNSINKTDPELPTNTITFTVSGLDSVTTYSFRIHAIDSAGVSEWSNVVTSKTTDFIIQRPNAPADVVSTSDVYNQIVVTWTDTSDDENKFYIQWAPDTEFADYNDEDIDADETTYTITGLIANTTYYVRIRTESDLGASEWVEINPVTTPPITVGVYKINNDEPYTSSPNVILNSNFDDVIQMRYANYGDSWSAWEPYSITKAWLLSTGDGEKVVGAEFKHADNSVTQLSDSIILDSTPVIVNSFVINSDALGTNTNFVTLTIQATGASVMRLKNDDGDWMLWESYKTSKGWLMTTTNGIKTVLLEVKDTAGNVTQVSDTITLDTVSPTINSFSINSEDDERSFSTDVILNIDVSGEPSSMRFQNSTVFGTWTEWEAFSPTKAWSITEGENADHYVYVEIKDALGNVSSTNDYIYLDEFSTLEIYTNYIYVFYDGDPYSSGEWYWHGYYTFNYDDGMTHDICTGTKTNVNDGDTIVIYEFVTVQFPNSEVQTFNLYYHAIEDDYPLDNDDVGIVRIDYFNSTKNIGHYNTFYRHFEPSSFYDYPVGYIGGYIKKID